MFNIILVMTELMLKNNKFYEIDVYSHLPRNYWKSDGCIYDVPDIIKDHNIIIFSGRVEGIDYPIDVSPRDVFVGINKGNGAMVIEQIFPDQRLILSRLFREVIDKDIVDELFEKDDILERRFVLS